MPDDQELQRARKLARVMDGFFVDPLLGMALPGAGDAIGSVLGLYTVIIAIRRKMSGVVIARMLLNLAVDAILGAIPIVGDLVDFAWRANKRNVALLEQHVSRGGRATARDWVFIAFAILAFVASIGVLIYVIVAVIRWIVAHPW
jgi:uncharacterized protein DUF4112